MSYFERYIIFPVYFTIHTYNTEKCFKQKVQTSDKNVPEQSAASSDDKLFCYAVSQSSAVLVAASLSMCHGRNHNLILLLFIP
jgi:hypothetical protein